MKLITNNYKATEVLRTIREWSELTQYEFGKSINYSMRTIQHYEEGTRRCTLDTFLEMAKVHDITITLEKKNSIEINDKLNIGKNTLKIETDLKKKRDTITE